MRLYNYLPYIEVIVVYVSFFLCILVYKDNICNDKLIIVLINISIFLGSLFSLFYGVHGIFFAIFGMFSAMFFIHKISSCHFAYDIWLISVIGIILFAAIGNKKESEQQNSRRLKESNRFLIQRNKHLIHTMVGMDISHRKYLSESYIRVDNSRYLFHELCFMLKNINNDVELFAKVFSALFRYNFVEGGIVYKKKEYSYIALFRYGVSFLPESISLMKDIPDWMLVLQREKKIIIPKVLDDKQFIIAIPIIKAKRNFIVIIERIRYTMKTSKTMDSLKIMSFLLQNTLEKKFSLQEDILKYSMAKNTLIYKPEISKNMLIERLKMLVSADVPFKLAFLFLRGKTEKKIEEIGILIEKIFRDTDDKFLIDDKLFILFAFAEEFSPIFEKAKKYIDINTLVRVSDNDVKYIIDSGSFHNVGNS